MNKRIRSLIVSVSSISLLFTLAFPSTSFGLARPQDSGCSGLSCYGVGSGGYGTHLAGKSGKGNLSGYNKVRFDAFRPDPNLISCKKADYEASRNRSEVNSLGLPTTAQDGTQYFVHHRVAVLRSDNVTVMNGVDGAENWGKGLDYNLNTGATRPSSNLTKAPTPGDPWVGPNWLGGQFCLPLTGDAAVKNQLTNSKPQISVLTKGIKANKIKGDVTIPSGLSDKDSYAYFVNNTGRVPVRAKDMSLQITITEATSTSGGVTINFKRLEDQVDVRVGDLHKFFQYIENPDEETARDIWVSARSSTAPVYADFSKKTITDKKTIGSVTTYTYAVPLVVKKKGMYSIKVEQIYNAQVGSATNSFTGLMGTSDSLWINAISVKSVNRK